MIVLPQDFSPSGIKNIINTPLTEDEQKASYTSADTIKNVLGQIIQVRD
jgi:malate/lactate dehydrogenase